MVGTYTRNYPAISGVGGEKLSKTAKNISGIGGVPAETRTEQLSNTSLERYCYTSLHGQCVEALAVCIVTCMGLCVTYKSGFWIG